MTDYVRDKNGRILDIKENGETVWSREEEMSRVREEAQKEAQAQTLARLYEMGELSQTAIDKIESNRPEVYQRAKEIVTEG